LGESTLILPATLAVDAWIEPFEPVVSLGP